MSKLARATGLDWCGSQHERMLGAVRRLKDQVGAESYTALSLMIENDEAVRALLVDRLTVGETFFFREPAHLEVVRAEARRSVEHQAPGRGGLRIWSAGCASGEEAYTLAMVLAEEGLLGSSRVVGTDLSPAAVQRGRAAVYGARSLRRCDDQQISTHFEHLRSGVRPAATVTAAVEFQVHNLLEGPLLRGAFDMAFCRNVLMYLDVTARERAVESLRDALVPGGWLVVGSADPTPDIDGIELVRTEHCIAFRRVAEGERPPTRAPSEGGVDAPPPRRRSAPSDTTRRRVTEEPRRSVAVHSSRAGSHLDEDSANQLRSLASRGRLDDAEQLMHRAIAARPLDAELRYIAATVHLHADRLGEAATAAAAATYLDPSLAVAHLLLGRIDDLRGSSTRARRSYQNALELLSSVPADAMVPLADGESAGALAAVAADLAGGT